MTRRAIAPAIAAIGLARRATLARAASDPRAVARQILHERRFHRSSLPQPLRKPLHRLGDGLKPIGHALRSAFRSIDRVLPGGSWIVWVLLVGAVALLTVVLARRVTARAQRRATAGDGPPGDGGIGGPSRRELERQAEEAERAGRFDAAVRLRFGAGLLALAQRGVIEERASLRTGEVRAALRSDGFDTIARDFDEVVYGGRAALAHDARAAREGWSDVLREVRR